MRGPGFIHLHVHSAYSLLEGALPLGKVIKQAIADWPGTLAKAHGARDFALSHFSLEAGTARLSEAVQQIAACAAKKT